MTPQFKRSFQARALSLAISATVVNVGGFTMLFCSDAARADDLAQAACPQVSGEQQRILQAATGGVDALRNHLWMRRGIRAYDLEQTVRWIDSVRESSAGCAAEGERVPIAQVEPDRDAPAAEVR